MKINLSGKKLLVLMYFAVFVLLYLLSNLAITHLLEIKSLGWRISLRDWLIPPEKSKSIVVVTVDKYSIKELGERWPWSRDKYIRFIETLTSSQKNGSHKGPRVIAFDLIFAAPDRKYDEAFSEAIKNFKNIVLAVAYEPQESTDEELVVTPLSLTLQKANPYLGNIVIASSPEDKVYSLPVFRNMKDPVKNEIVPVPLFEITIAELFTGSTLELKRNCFLLGSRRIPLFITAQDRRLAHKKRYEFLINYSGTPEKVFQSYHFADVLKGRVPPETFEEKVVLVMNTLNPNDRFRTTREDFTFNGKNSSYIFGGYVHAYASRTLLENKAITSYLDIYLLLYLPLALIALLIFIKVKDRIRAFTMVMLVLLGYAVLCHLLFMCYYLWIPTISPIMGVLLFSAGYVAIEYYTMKKALRALLPSSFAERLDPLSSDFKAGGKPIWASVLFADIRGYTNLSESLSSEQVFNMLVEYHTMVKKPLYENGGEIFDFQGDAYMVVFGADGKTKDHARKAVRAALGICDAIEALRQKWEQEGKKSFDIGIGICTGEVTLGYIGHREGEDRKLQPAAIGDTTNVAARLQGKSSEFKTPILITETTMKELEGDPPTISLAAVEVKGKSHRLSIYTVDWEKIKSRLPDRSHLQSP